MYNPDHFRMFVAAVETGSFTAAARKLGRVQSAVSQGISVLEDDLNVELFDRSTRKPTLTADGERILTYAHSILQQLDELKATTQAIHRGEEALVRIAMDDALALPSLTRILTHFSARFPCTEIEIINKASTDITDFIKANRADIGITFCDTGMDTDVHECFIGHLPFIAVCRADHPLATAKELQLTDLLPHREIMLRGEAGIHSNTSLKLSSVCWYASDYTMICRMVEDGFGWSMLPEHSAQEGIRSGRFVRLNFSFEHNTPWSPPVGLVIARNKALGPATSWLFSELKSLTDHQD